MTWFLFRDRSVTIVTLLIATYNSVNIILYVEQNLSRSHGRFRQGCTQETSSLYLNLIIYNGDQGLQLHWHQSR